MRNHQNIFQWMNHFIFPSLTYEHSNFSTSLLTVIFIFKVVANLVGVKSYLTVILIYISLIISDVEHLFMSYWPFIYLHWRNVYLNPLLIFFLSFIEICLHAKSLQSCPTLYNPMDHSLPGFSVQGISQAKILE